MLRTQPWCIVSEYPASAWRQRICLKIAKKPPKYKGKKIVFDFFLDTLNPLFLYYYLIEFTNQFQLSPNRFLVFDKNQYFGCMI